MPAYLVGHRCLATTPFFGSHWTKGKKRKAMIPTMIFIVNVGKYTMTMDPMGTRLVFQMLLLFHVHPFYSEEDDFILTHIVFKWVQCTT